MSDLDTFEVVMGKPEKKNSFFKFNSPGKIYLGIFLAPTSEKESW